MDWIKKNYDQFALVIVALILLGLSVLLILDVMGFNETFASIRGEVVHNDKIPPLDLATLEQAQAAIQKPASWAPKTGAGSLFVSKQYLVKDGKLINPLEQGGEMLHPPVPNSWFVENNLEILDPDILNQDPDSDGFSNVEEWHAKTGPNDKDSHPAYTSKLRLKKFIKKPFRLLFNAYDGDPARPETLSFQINTVDVRQPSQFRKLGEQIQGTKFKVIKFEKKTLTDSNGVEKDLSELTVQNQETSQNVVLVLEKIVDSPDSYALFKYLWDGSEFQVKKDKPFTLKPDESVQYKLIDITESEALIETPKGEKLKIPRLEDVRR